MAKLPQYFAVDFTFAGVAATTPYVLIDLSDTTNFPHHDTNMIIVRSIHFDAFLSAHSAVWTAQFGTIIEVDATNGTANVFAGLAMFNQDGGNLQYSKAWDFNHRDYMHNTVGLNTLVDTTAGSEKLELITTNATDAGSTNWQTDTNLASPAGTTTAPGAGDMVLLLTELLGTATINGNITVVYSTK